MAKALKFILAIVVVLVIIAAVHYFMASPGGTSSSPITLNSPLPGSAVSSPLHVTGIAPSAWYFEAQFGIDLATAKGKILASTGAHTDEDWTSGKPAKFEADLTFPAQPSGTAGYLVFKKDNPSGDPARDVSVKVPLIFK